MNIKEKEKGQLMAKTYQKPNQIHPLRIHTHTPSLSPISISYNSFLYFYYVLHAQLYGIQMIYTNTYVHDTVVVLGVSGENKMKEGDENGFIKCRILTAN